MPGLRFQLSRSKFKMRFSTRAIPQARTSHRLRVVLWFMASVRAGAVLKLRLGLGLC